MPKCLFVQKKACYFVTHFLFSCYNYKGNKNIVSGLALKLLNPTNLL